MLCADRGDDAFYNGKCYAVTADRCHKYAIGSRSYWVCADYNTIILIFKANDFTTLVFKGIYDWPTFSFLLYHKTDTYVFEKLIYIIREAEI